MGKPIWSMWARYMGTTAAWLIVLGGVTGFFYPDYALFLPWYAIGVGIFVFLWDLPFPGLTYLGVLFKSLYLRAILYILMSGPLFLDVPTSSGALCLLATGIAYLSGALSGESYIHPGDYNKKKKEKAGERRSFVISHQHLKDKKAIPEGSRVLSL